MVARRGKGRIRRKRRPHARGALPRAAPPCPLDTGRCWESPPASHPPVLAPRRHGPARVYPFPPLLIPLFSAAYTLFSAACTLSSPARRLPHRLTRGTASIAQPLLLRSRGTADGCVCMWACAACHSARVCARPGIQPWSRAMSVYNAVHWRIIDLMNLPCELRSFQQNIAWFNTDLQ